MWSTTWVDPPASEEEHIRWRVYTRVWKDAGLKAPGLWIIEWYRKGYDDADHIYYGRTRQAVAWYVNECKE